MKLIFSIVLYLTYLWHLILFCLENELNCSSGGRSDGAMVLGKLPVPGRPTNLD